MPSEAFRYALSLASTVSGLAACLLLAAATLRGDERLRRIGVGTAVATGLAAAVAVWPPARWTDWAAAVGIVTGLPLLGAALYVIGAGRHRALSAVGIAVLLIGVLVSIPVFGERFVAP